MARPARFSPQKKQQIVLAVVRGEVSVAEAARGPTGQEAQLEHEVSSSRRRSARRMSSCGSCAAAARRVPFQELELMRAAAGLSVTGFCALAGIPRTTWYRRRAAADRPTRSWPAPVRDRIEQPAAQLALEWPTWGNRKIWALLAADGHQPSQATVRRAPARRGLLQPADVRRERRELARARKAAFVEPVTRRNRVWQTDFSELGDHRGAAPGSRRRRRLRGQARAGLPGQRDQDLARGGLRLWRPRATPLATCSSARCSTTSPTPRPARSPRSSSSPTTGRATAPPAFARHIRSAARVQPTSAPATFARDSTASFKRWFELAEVRAPLPPLHRRRPRPRRPRQRLPRRLQSSAPARGARLRSTHRPLPHRPRQHRRRPTPNAPDCLNRLTRDTP